MMCNGFVADYMRQFDLCIECIIHGELFSRISAQSQEGSLLNLAHGFFRLEPDGSNYYTQA